MNLPPEPGPRRPPPDAERYSPVFEHSRFDDLGEPSQFGDTQPTPLYADPARQRGGDMAIGPMGQAFVEAGKLTQDEVARIIQVQRRRRIRFGEAAIRLGLLTEEDVHEVLARQFNYQTVVSRGLQASKAISPSLLIAHAPYSNEAETIRRFRSEILLRAGEQACLVLALTSPNPREGKSHLAASLAVAFSQLNLKTLLIDANLRKPVQHHLFKVANKAGLSTMLVGRTAATLDLSHAISPYLSVLTAGPKPPNPSEILNFPNLAELLDAFRHSVKVIVIDTPAIRVGPDAQIVAPQAGHVVLVCRKHHTRIESLHKAFAQLETTSAHILGTFLNTVPASATLLTDPLPWWRRWLRLRPSSRSDSTV